MKKTPPECHFLPDERSKSCILALIHTCQQCCLRRRGKKLYRELQGGWRGGFGNGEVLSQNKSKNWCFMPLTLTPPITSKEMGERHFLGCSDHRGHDDDNEEAAPGHSFASSKYQSLFVWKHQIFKYNLGGKSHPKKIHNDLWDWCVENIWAIKKHPVNRSESGFRGDP